MTQSTFSKLYTSTLWDDELKVAIIISTWQTLSSKLESRSELHLLALISINLKSSFSDKMSHKRKIDYVQELSTTKRLERNNT